MRDTFMERMPEYPPEYDMESACLTCRKLENDCDCPECPECSCIGDPHCYETGHMKPLPDSVQSLVDYLGCGSTLSENFHAIERHSEPMHGLWVILSNWEKHGSPGYEKELVDKIPNYTRIERVGVSGIAWDGSDWEFYEEAQVVSGDWKVIGRLLDTFTDALSEHCFEMEEFDRIETIPVRFRSK